MSDGPQMYIFGAGRRRSGRPAIYGERASRRIEIVVTTEQRRELERLSEALNVDVATLVRAAILHKVFGGDRSQWLGGSQRRLAKRDVRLSGPDRRRAFYEGARRRASRGEEAMVEFVDPAVVYERDRGLCGICDRFVPPEEVSMDHRVPMSKGGDHSYDNIQTAHRLCNSRKGNRL